MEAKTKLILFYVALGILFLICCLLIFYVKGPVCVEPDGYGNCLKWK